MKEENKIGYLNQQRLHRIPTVTADPLLNQRRLQEENLSFLFTNKR